MLGLLGSAYALLGSDCGLAEPGRVRALGDVADPLSRSRSTLKSRTLSSSR